MSTAEGIARALGGNPSGEGYAVCCPVPNHGNGRGDHRPSLFIKDGQKALLVKCFAGCEASDVLSALRERGLLRHTHVDYFGVGIGLGARKMESLDRAIAEVEPDPSALEIWRAATPLIGTLGERYLREHRGINSNFPQSLRFHPIAKCGGYQFPALVSGLQRLDGLVVAVQLTFLNPRTGTKVWVQRPRKNVGALGSSAVRLGPAGEVLGLAEGVETALSAMQLAGIPSWASLGSQRLARLAIPVNVREVHIFADNDEPGRTGAEKAAERLTREGRLVRLRFPPADVCDWNDVLRPRRQAA